MIELLVAGLLTVVLMAALVSVLRAMVRETRHAEQSRRTDQQTRLVSEQLRRDIQNAQGISIEPHGLRLFGFIGREPTTGMPNLCQAAVTYRIRWIGDHGVLWREEVPLEGTPLGRPRVEPVWVGVARVETVILGTVDGEAGMSGMTVRETGGLAPMPTRLRVVLRDESQRPILSETIFHHKG